MNVSPLASLNSQPNGPGAEWPASGDLLMGGLAGGVPVLRGDIEAQALGLCVSAHAERIVSHLLAPEGLER
jgi:hypothetical protein